MPVYACHQTRGDELATRPFDVGKTRNSVKEKNVKVSGIYLKMFVFTFTPFYYYFFI